MGSLFQFKQFVVQQDKCAMKIGTDGVLLGAWTSLKNNPERILDIGTGTGIIALQMAQRSLAESIDALEIDPDAYEQCVENFEASPWGDRLFCYHASIAEFAEEYETEVENENDDEDEFEIDKYDLIVSNPPFYSEDYKTDNTARDTARFVGSLPFQHLVLCVSKLLTDEGIFSVILPKKEENNFIQLASEVKLFPHRICNVRGTENSAIKRVLMEFSFEEKPTETEYLTIEISRHNYTEAYKNLVKDFYLKL